MKHYLKSKDETFKHEAEMICNHPDKKDKSVDSIDCNGDCRSCKYSMAAIPIPGLAELLKRAECDLEQ